MKDWNGDSIWNYGTNLSKGVSVLFNKNVAFRLMAKDHIENGRVISLKIEINGHKIQIINIYAPNNSVERKRFYNNMSTVFDDEYAHILAAILTVHRTTLLTESLHPTKMIKASKN